jgi:F-type H+-transporting ATPase subunit b
MPQFDVAYFSSQIFWLLICFSVIYLLVKKIFMPRMSQIIDDRTDKIEQLRLDAEKLSQKLADINVNIEALRKDSILKYSKIIADAKLRSNKKRSDFIQENQKQILDLQNKSDLFKKDIIKEYDNSSQNAIDVLIKAMSNKLMSKKIN